MEIEKKFWDMRKGDYIEILLRYWILIAIISAIAGASMFMYGYISNVLTDNYTSKIEYQFLYQNSTDADVTSNTNYGSAIYVNAYTYRFLNDDVLKDVEDELSTYKDETLHFNISDLKRITEVSTYSINLTISVTTGTPENSKIVLETLQKHAMLIIDKEIETIRSADGGYCTINALIPYPGIGVKYESDEEITLGLLVEALIIFGVLCVVFYGLIVVATNFNGKFKSNDVFENNYQIPVLGEIKLKVYKEIYSEENNKSDD